ncbi:PH domain-containing protein [Actinacidiphila acidipaludis]|uniref:PH domain-containing protein n=1 Tax=Actinacidiphila acidipaludis TaxID=2873382 RepID=A0ABS7Q234_9ACTN|nr:PH domain-containing protein [Streptomyces acidipaludis]MBY8877192.1 PH domain-containing protein [Streptomyces acidipaludis]
MRSSHQDRPKGPATAGDGQPQYADRVYRSMAGMCGGVLLLVLAFWLGGDAILRGHGRTPWLALAGLLLAVPVVVAFTLRPAVYASTERIKIRNPFRTITLPWSAVDRLRAAYSTELFSGERKFQLWAIPVSLRARKRASRMASRAQAAGDDPFGSAPRRRANLRPGGEPHDPTRAWGDQALDELRELSDRHPVPEDSARAEAQIRWCFELVAPALAGLIVFLVLLAV